MTNQEAIEFGNMWLQINEDCKDSSTYVFFQMAIKALEQEPKTGHWILATIELPNKYELCLCEIRNTDTYNNQIEIYPYLLVYNNDEVAWYRDDGYECEYEVIAWMYAPNYTG